MRGKRDLTEAAIVAALTKAGCTVDYVEKRPYDLVVGRAQQTYLLECKSHKGRLQASQNEFREFWNGHYEIVRTPSQALKAVGL